MESLEGQLFIGVDAGGTRTRAICVSGSGEVLGSGLAGPANHATAGLASARACITEAVHQATAFHRSDRPLSVSAVFIGSAGLEHAGSEAEGRRLVEGAVDARHVQLDTDAYVAWAGAFRCQPGIVVIAGTGSICLGVDQAGNRSKVGGWGWRVGDEGSAYALAVDAMRVAVATSEGRAEAPLLWRALGQFLDLGQPGGADDEPLDGLAVRAWLYAPERRPADIAAFAPWIARAANEGCSTSKSILKAGGAELAGLVAAVARSLPGGRHLPVAAAGGVLANLTPVRSAFRAAIATHTELGSYVEPAYAPQLGAALLAMLAAGQQLEPAMFRRLDAYAASDLKPA